MAPGCGGTACFFVPILNHPHSLTKNIPVTHPGLQLLRKGQVGLMLSEQEYLPRLPINDLESAIKDFLRASEPLLSREQFAQTKAQAEEFLKEDGPRLHELLVGYDKEDGRNSYLEVVYRWLAFSKSLCNVECVLHSSHAFEAAGNLPRISRSRSEHALPPSPTH